MSNVATLRIKVRKHDEEIEELKQAILELSIQLNNLTPLTKEKPNVNS